MENKGNSKKTLNENIKTQYLGTEETEYVEIDGVEETEYIDIKTGKIPKDIILNDRYKIISTIGKGGMGAVYKALDMRLRGIEVAIKEISLETIEDERIEKVIKNFENEAATLISLRHNAIPRVMDFFSLNKNKCYIVMDLIDGETLDEVIKKRGKIPENEVREWINQLADVLKYLHSREPKIIFRDLKPSNVMLTKDNQIKLIDFGIARTFKDDKSTDTTYYVSKGFSPPEQYGTGQSDERSDIYSLGALAYSLLIGGKPTMKNFKFENLKDFVNVSDELNAAIMKATEFRPENRPNSIDEFLYLLNKDSVKNISSNKKRNIIIILSLIIIGGIITSYLSTNHEKDDKYTNVNKTNNNVLGSISNEESTSKETDSDVKKAIDKLYEVTNDSKTYTVYNLNTGDSYVRDPRIKKDYYIFNVSTPNGYLADFNYAVNKKDYSVYECSATGIVIPYKTKGSGNNLDKYLTDYETTGESNVPETTKNYLQQHGALALNKKTEEILKDALPMTIEHVGGPVLYVDAILRGNSKAHLDTEVFTYTESEFNVETFLDDMFKTYVNAVKSGDPSMMYSYVTSGGQSYKEYTENIPKYHKKGITVDLLSYKINNMKVNSKGECIINCTTEFKINGPNGTKIQKERADYVIERIANTEFLLDRIENWSIVK
ncbi:serine/threonine-protein kinase [Paraclostridium sordellii]|uniref:serine/threonine-protein kinase n=1 Tax=Paraclostridium sordellii TaxID=1505 RepID=UPI0030D22C22